MELLLEPMNGFVNRNRWMGDFGKELVIVGGLSIESFALGLQSGRGSWINNDLKDPSNSIQGNLWQKTRRIAQVLPTLIVGILREYLDNSGQRDGRA